MPDFMCVFVIFIRIDRNSRSNIRSKSPAMDIRPARLMISYPAVQHGQPHVSILSPNAKSIYNFDYLHQMSAQVSDRYRTQPNEFYNSSANNASNSNRSSYSNERNNGNRYNNTNGSNANKYSNKVPAPASNSSASPPLSITSSGSSTNSGKNVRGSKSFNGNSMQSMNTHRNIPTTPTMQQSHNGYYQSQSIPFFHSTSSNGMQQIFSSAISPTGQTQHSNQSVGLYVQNNSTAAYHPNNNYHSHNRNYHSNGNKKNWHYYK